MSFKKRVCDGFESIYVNLLQQLFKLIRMVLLLLFAFIAHVTKRVLVHAWTSGHLAVAGCL